MTTLIFNNVLRTESDSNIIAQLTRKGWEIVPTPSPPILPDPPVIDKSQKRCVYNPNTNTYAIVDLTDEEKAAYIESENQKQRLLERQRFLDTVNNGYTVQPENFTLGLLESDRNAFSQMLGLIKEALDFNLISGDTLQTISDKNGEKHQITTNRFRQIIVQYGFYFKTLWDQLDS